MNKLAILIFSPITILSAPKSPELGDNNLTFLNKFNSNTTIMPVFDLRYDGIKGSKFFYNEYMDGEIWMSNNRHFTTEYKFDEEKNTIQVQLKEGKEASLFNAEAMPQKKRLLEAFFEDHEGSVKDYEISALLEKTEKNEQSD